MILLALGQRGGGADQVIHRLGTGEGWTSGRGHGGAREGYGSARLAVRRLAPRQKGLVGSARSFAAQGFESYVSVGRALLGGRHTVWRRAGGGPAMRAAGAPVGVKCGAAGSDETA